MAGDPLMIELEDPRDARLVRTGGPIPQEPRRQLGSVLITDVSDDGVVTTD